MKSPIQVEESPKIYQIHRNHLIFSQSFPPKKHIFPTETSVVPPFFPPNSKDSIGPPLLFPSPQLLQVAFAKVREITASHRKRQHRVALGMKVKDVEFHWEHLGREDWGRMGGSCSKPPLVDFCVTGDSTTFQRR